MGVGAAAAAAQSLGAERRPDRPRQGRQLDRPVPPAASTPRVMRLLDDALQEYQAALVALKNDDLAGYQQHIQRMAADLQQADQLEHGSSAAPSG